MLRYFQGGFLEGAQKPGFIPSFPTYCGRTNSISHQPARNDSSLEIPINLLSYPPQRWPRVAKQGKNLRRNAICLIHDLIPRVSQCRVWMLDPALSRRSLECVCLQVPGTAREAANVCWSLAVLGLHREAKPRAARTWGTGEAMCGPSAPRKTSLWCILPRVVTDFMTFCQLVGFPY